jgi:hyperosmotically inducible periplasmic protein
MNMKSASCLIVAGAMLGAFAGCATENHSSSARNETMTEKVEDGWITTKIKSEFAVNNRVSATNIHVNTDNGVVHLSGMAKNQDEANQAVSIARGIKGVKSVRNEMQIQGVGATR